MADETQLTIRIGERGEYNVTPPFSNREMHVIKQVAGVRAAEFEAAVEAGDTDLLVALAHIAVRRTGQARPTLDDLWEMPAGDITAVVPGDTGDTEPQDPTPADANGVPETTPLSSGSPSTGMSST